MAGHIDPSLFDERIEALTAALDGSESIGARALAKALVGAVLDFHKTGLTRVVEAVSDDMRVRTRLLADPLVRSLLALHDLSLAPPPPLIQILRPSPASGASAGLAGHHGGACSRCGVALHGEHRHVVDVESRRLSCRCSACWRLSAQGAHGAVERAVPDRYRRAVPFELGPSHWEGLEIPVGVAFFMRNARAGRTIAFYPGPAGATESALTLDTLAALTGEQPSLAALEPDVEALLVRRQPQSGVCSCWVVPIDACYELAGRLRLSNSAGGAALGAALDAFFSEVDARCGHEGSEAARI